MKLFVLGGGASNEREVSLRSAGCVAAAAREAGYEVEEYDPKDGLEFLKSAEPEVVALPILHGEGGEDGVLQENLDKLKVPYLGSGAKSSALCWDKWQTLETMSKAGIPIAKSQLVDRKSLKDYPIAAKPYVLKVRRGGSSLGVLIARDPSKVSRNEVESVFDMGEPAILEELIDGTEITIAVLGDQALPVVEIRPPENGEFDYENKYNGASQELCPPQNVDEKTQRKAQALALKAHNVLGCRHLSRTDMMVGKSGNLFVIDVNTMPGLTDQSLFPKAAKAAGVTMPELVHQFVTMVRTDYHL